MKRLKCVKEHGIDLIGDVILYGIMLICALLFLFPLYHVLILSFSNPADIVSRGGLIIIPKKICFDAYRIVLENKHVITGLNNTLIYILVGVSIQYIVTILAGYALSLNELPGKRIIWAYFIATMYLNGGIIPTYLLVSKLGMLNTIWSITLPGAVSISYLIIMRTQFESIPRQIKDAAQIDGANHFVMLFKIMLPLSVATSSVIMLFGIVTYWNMWYEPMIYTTKRSMYPLQSVLREILIDNTFIVNAGRSHTNALLLRQANKGTALLMMKYAIIVLSTLPMLILYPFVQKRFVAGILIGSIKG